MASSDGGDVPAGRAAAAVNDLMEAREGAARLRGFLLEQSSPWAELVDGMMDKMSSALLALETAAADDDGAVRQTAESSAAGATTRKRRRSSSGSRVGRSRRPSDRRVAATLADGHIWRKYGQKEIQNSRNPRSYYRCTHKSTQGCDATRHVHVCDADPSKYAITYYGEHTCNSYPSTIPTTVVDAARTASDARANNLISFAPGHGAASRAGGASSPWAVEGGVGTTTTQLCSSWTCATSDLSSSAEPFVQVDELAAVVGSAGTTSWAVGSAPDYAGMMGGMAAAGGGVTGSFRSSPNSLGFVVGSLESIGDVFLFDP